jgi:alcohol dehydrogenase class IV
MPALGPFQLSMPKTICFGVGSLARLPEWTAGARRILLLTGGHYAARESLPPELLSLEEARSSSSRGRFIEHAVCPAGEPTTDGVQALCEHLAMTDPDLILAVGGGSVLDTAKALSVLLRYPGRPEEYMEGVSGAREIPGPGVPWIGVPTTAGTGAEATKNAVLRSVSLGLKRSMRSPFLMAEAVIVDPLLTRGLAAPVTGATGLDAFVQLLEAFVSRRATVPVRALVRSALVPHLSGLRVLAEDPSDEAARTAVSYGALISGIALANAGLGAAHGFAAAIGGRFPIPHGLLCAVFLPAVLALNAEAIREDLTAVLEGTARGDPINWLSDFVRSTAALYGLPTDLSSYSIPRSLVPELALLAAGSSMRGNPRDLTQEEKERTIALLI